MGTVGGKLLGVGREGGRVFWIRGIDRVILFGRSRCTLEC